MIVTGRMVVLAMVLAVLLAVVAGVLSAVRQYSAVDYSFTFAGFLFLSMPVFWLAALLKEFLAIKLNSSAGHTVLYTVGDSTPGLTGGVLSNLPNYLGHLVLPTIALAAATPRANPGGSQGHWRPKPPRTWTAATRAIRGRRSCPSSSRTTTRSPPPGP